MTRKSITYRKESHMKYVVKVDGRVRFTLQNNRLAKRIFKRLRSLTEAQRRLELL